MAVRENLIELAKKLSDGHYPIDENCAEYKCFDSWITDDQITVLLAMDLLQPAFPELVAETTGFTPEKTLDIYDITDCNSAGNIRTVLYKIRTGKDAAV